MGDDHRAAGEAQQRLLERAQRVDVEVVGRLVEQQHVAAACAAAWPGAARLRSPPESLPTFFCWSEPLKLKFATYWRELTSRSPTLMWSSPPEISSQTVLSRVQRVARLVDVGELHRLADAQRARVGLLLADDHPEQRRLAGAVGADHADDPGGRQREREVLDQQAVAEALAQAVGLDHHVAQPRAGRDVDLDLVELDVALLGEQRLVVVQARLGLLAPALGVLAHPLELARRSCAGGRSPRFSSWARRACFCSSQLE